MTTGSIPPPSARAEDWARLAERAEPWGSDAFAAGAGLIALSGVVAIGIYAGIGDGRFSGTWGWVLTGLAIIAAYLAELVVERPTTAACTAVIAAGVPAALVFAQWPFGGYSDIRVVEIASIVIWLAMFIVGGTRARAVFLGLALVVAWAFVVGEAANIENTFASRSVPIIGLGGATFGDPQLGGGDCSTSDGGVSCTTPESPTFAAPGVGDRTLPIGITSGIAAVLFAIGLRRSDATRRFALGTAFVIPLVLATNVAVSALATKVDSVWFGGVLALVAGLAVAWVARRRHRFLAWIGALGAASGVLLVTGDLNGRIGGGGGNGAVLRYGLLALAFGVAAVAGAAPIAVLLGETPRVAWARRRPQPPMPVPPQPPA